METPEMINNKKTRRYKAGDVVVMEYSGDGKPCDKAMAILLTSFTVKDGYVQDGEFRTMYAIDTNKEQFLPSGPIATRGVECNIAKATPKLKAWFFEQIVKHCQKPAETESHEPEKVYVFTAEQAWDGETADVIVKAFRTREAAREFKHKFIHEPVDGESIVDYVKRKDWYVEMDEPDLYRACEDGRYPTDHIEITITECNIE